MRNFLIKAYKPAKDDPFIMISPDGNDHIMFSCTSLTDLYKTLRCITPQGYRVPKPPTLSKRLNWNGGILESKNIFGHKTLEIKEVVEKVNILKSTSYTNSFGFTHVLKTTDFVF